MKKLLISCMILMALLSGCGAKIDQDAPESEIQETEPPQTETPPWMNEEYETAPPPPETLIPDSDEIDDSATSLDSLAYEVFAKSNTAMITDFTGSETEIVITSHIGKYPVTEIGQYAFEAAWNVTDVALPESITVIHEQAFADCESLTSINIPEGVTSIERGAFSGCVALTELTLPASLTDTAEEMLTGCELTDLYILNPNLNYTSWGLQEAETKCVIHAPEGSAILTWAEENDFPTDIIY